MSCRKDGSLEQEPALAFRNAIRDARANALADAEDFHSLIRVMERLANHLCGKDVSLGDKKARKSILKLLGKEAAEVSVSAYGVSRLSAAELYDLVRHARNDAVHEGIFARNLSQHLVQLSILVEDALVDDALCPKIKHYMTSDPKTAEPWEQIKFVRQKMLANSYSHIPIRIEKSWKILSDHGIAIYLWGKGEDSSQEMEGVKSKLSCRLGSAINAESGSLPVESAKLVGPEDSVDTVLREHSDYMKRGLPLLGEEKVRAGGDKDGGKEEGKSLLVGIVTAFDLLFAPRFEVRGQA